MLLSLKPSQIFVRPATTILTKATKQRSIRFRRNRVLTVALAIEALATIENDEALDQIEKAITFGLPPDNPASYEESDDKFAPIRYLVVLGLKHCKSAAAKSLLERATSDPHSEIRAFAGEIIRSLTDA